MKIRNLGVLVCLLVAASAFAAGNPNLQPMAGTWAGEDSANAGKWLAGLPAGPAREAAVAAYVGQLANALPELAAPWAEGLVDVQTRWDQIENVARSWLEEDRAAAEAWLSRVDLPAERKRLLLGGN